MNQKALMKRYKKTVINSLWVHVTLVTCYYPITVVTTLSTRGSSRAELVAVGLMNLNSLLNPILYYWKIKEVRGAVKETIAVLLSFFRLRGLRQKCEQKMRRQRSHTRKLRNLASKRKLFRISSKVYSV